MSDAVPTIMKDGQDMGSPALSAKAYNNPTELCLVVDGRGKGTWCHSKSFMLQVI